VALYSAFTSGQVDALPPLALQSAEFTELGSATAEGGHVGRCRYARQRRA
jgi:hypothetical protein